MYFFCCQFFIGFEGFSQQKKYFIEFIDKKNSPYSLSKPLEFLSQRSIDRRERQSIALSERDLPVNPVYIQQIRQLGAVIWYSSRWMNGVLLEADASTLDQITKLAFVKPVTDENRLNNRLLIPENRSGKIEATKQTATIDYGSATRQNRMLGIDKMHEVGFAGKDVHIAVMDGGFYQANAMNVFGHLYENQQLLGTYDFVRKQENVYDRSSHGSEVLSVIAANSPGTMVGPAYDASFWLLRTENEDSEYRLEEVNWLIAAEFADSVGVDIINTSLGYNYFDDASMDYLPEQMDGKTALITRAANMAAATGMLVVVSAGNEGSSWWRTLSAPADADSVLAVAAVDNSELRASFSSIGKIIGGSTIKPNVAAQGVGTVVMTPSNSLGTDNGTSLATPLITGLAAGLWQAFPDLTNMQLLDFIQRSGSQAERPDTLLGYGVPDFTIVSELIRKETDPNAPIGYLSPNPVTSNEVMLRVNITHLDKPINIEFFDVQGRRIYTHTIANPVSENSVRISPDIFRMGLYIVKIYNSDSQVVTRLVRL
ncbi:S8 family serine peptidase [Xanthocytophaga agilis]|uniref:S8 family serine peptidase n=1 Tax=Xanthocytophaga agilis TaxID=3048010 RepID=UPI0028D2ED38|nr:S8 family serine peptidase [Xanthocytophaga agilis]